MISICILACMFPSAAFASDNILQDLLDKIQTMAEEDPSEAVPEVLPAANEPFSASALYNEAAPKVVEIYVADEEGYYFSSASGFFINDQGDIVTNYHVIEDGYSATVLLENGDEYEVKYVLAYDKTIDLAVLRIDISGNEYLQMAKDPAATGDTIYTLGSALGFTGTFSDGMVSSASRIIDGVDFIQITAPISNGNSGGPLLNTKGEVLGVNTMNMTSGQNMNFAVNINELTRLDYTDPITMQTLYAREADVSGMFSLSIDTDDPELVEWMEDSDYMEVEYNGEMDYADLLSNDTWMGGWVEDEEDFDFFGIILTEASLIDMVIIPFYKADNEYIITALLDSEYNIVDFSSEEEYDGMVYQRLDYMASEPGVYYLAVCVADGYPYNIPAYYQLNASW